MAPSNPSSKARNLLNILTPFSFTLPTIHEGSPFPLVLPLTYFFSIHPLSLLFYNRAFTMFLKFIWERERVRARTHEQGRGRERESQAGSMLSGWGLAQGLNSRIMRSWPALKPRVRCLSDWATQAPQALFLFLISNIIYCQIGLHTIPSAHPTLSLFLDRTITAST